MLEAAYMLIGVFGVAAFAAGFFVIIREVAVDSPFDLFLSLLSPRRSKQVWKLVEAHIRGNWPETKVVGVLYYGGISLLVLAWILYCLDEYLA